MNNVPPNQQEPAMPAQLVELEEIQAQPVSGTSILGGNPALLSGVKVSLTAVVGEIATSLGELLSLQEAALLKIDRTIDMPIDLVVNGQVVARGQLVAIDDNFGVRVTEIAAAAKP